MGKIDGAIEFDGRRVTYIVGCVFIVLLGSVCARADDSDVDLNGLWEDGQRNILQISQNGTAINAAAFRLTRQMQTKYGWQVGDASFRGTLRHGNETITGDIHQRFPVEVKKTCPKQADFWTHLRLRVAKGGNELTGTWKIFDLKSDCTQVEVASTERKLFRLVGKMNIWELEDVREQTVNYRSRLAVATPKDDWLHQSLRGAFRIIAMQPSSDADAINTIRVTLSSDTDPNGIDLKLSETGPGSNRFRSDEAVTIDSMKPSGGAHLRITPGDRIYLRYEGKIRDVVWTTGGGYEGRGCGKASTPLWRIPDSKQQYMAMRKAWKPVSVVPVQLDKGSKWKKLGTKFLDTEVFEMRREYFRDTSVTLKNIFNDPQYKTAEEIILLKWRQIQAAAARENIPASLLGAILLQQMRAMNYEDLMYDGQFNVGPVTFDGGDTIGISQTPYYIVQRLARDVGLPALGIVKGTTLTREQAVDLLFDPDPSIDIAAAHIRMLTDLAQKYLDALPAAHANVLKPNFDLARIKTAGEVTDDERNVAYVIGINEDQWQMDTAEPYEKSPSDDGYGKAVVVALEDIRRHLDASGRLKASITATPRTYAEDTYPDDSWKRGCYFGFKGGDMLPNVFPRDGLVNDRIKKEIEAKASRK